jgi:hypothetical protein
VSVTRDFRAGAGGLEPSAFRRFWNMATEAGAEVGSERVRSMSVFASVLFCRAPHPEYS